MRLGTGIFLLAVGAILVFAIDVQVSGVDLDVVGWILMAVGALGVLIELAVWAPRRRRVVRTDDEAGRPVRRSTTEETY